MQALGAFFTCGAPLDEAVLRPVWTEVPVPHLTSRWPLTGDRSQCGAASGRETTGEAVVAVLNDSDASSRLVTNP